MPPRVRCHNGPWVHSLQGDATTVCTSHHGVPVQGQPGGTPGVTDAVGGTSAVLVLTAYLAMFVAASAVLTNRRDVA